MRLPALEFLERRKIRIGVIERDDETERDLVVRLVVEERPAASVSLSGQPCGVDHSARVMFLGRSMSHNSLIPMP